MLFCTPGECGASDLWNSAESGDRLPRRQSVPIGDQTQHKELGDGDFMKQRAFAASLVCIVFVLGCGDAAERQPESTSQSPSITPPQAKEEVTAANTNPVETLPTAAELKTRQFTFHYRFQVKDLKSAENSADSVVRVWLPVASTSDEQEVQRLEVTAPSEVSEATDPEFGNRILFFETTIPESGAFAVEVPYEITRREVLRGPAHAVVSPVAKLDEARCEFFLRSDAMVPTVGKPLKLLDMVDLLQDKFARARQLYDIVDNHVAYKKVGTGWGRGDTNWVCDSRYGNCTDFHSLFISLARSQGLPSRFEIGFSIPTDKPEGPIAGYHCWAWFYTDERGWIPVDISEADKNPMMKDYYFGGLTPDRVTFTVGRDISLLPKSASQPLNFFVYPHIEVGGKVLPKENVELKFAFKNQS